MTISAVLDAASPLERIKLVKALGDATAALQAATSPIGRVQAAKAVSVALAALGVGVGGAPVDAEEAPGVTATDDGLSDDPASANYRYKDTGYIADSRKEKAASMIKVARDNGQRVRATDIDWNAIEQNPRQAKELIVKSNLFGQTDWDALREAGMSPDAGFLIDKVYASIGPEPTTALPSFTAKALMSADSDLKLLSELDRTSPEAMAQTRRDYALGLETIRERLEVAKTVDEVLSVLRDIKDELTGVTLNAEQTDIMSALQAEYTEKRTVAKQAQAEKNSIQEAWRLIEQELQSLKYERDRRQRRGWKPDPETERKIIELEPRQAEAEKVFRDYVADHPELNIEKRTLASGGYNYLNDLEWEAQASADKMKAIRREARYFNLLSNPATRAWLSFGERFFRLLEYRSHRGSDAFGGHITTARAGKITDWSWTERESKAPAGRKPTSESINFQLKVAESYERKGGRKITVESTQSLKDMVGLRDVQSGNWVLRDQVSAKFHVEQTAAAMSDMADMLGIEMKVLGLGGRLGMAFGARGSGGKGAARAHYEPVHRVINLTKMGGGGTLGHEVFHAFDNILPAIVNGNAGEKGNFGSKNPELMPAGRLRDAFTALKEAMTSGPRRLNETIVIGPKDKKTAVYNIDGGSLNTIPRNIKSAGNLTDAIRFVDLFFAGRSDNRSLKNKKQWRTLAAAYYSEDGAVSVTAPTGQAVSEFMAEAQYLDGGSAGKYWSTVEELAARAFQSYLEDKLASQDRRNDYLSVFADNKFHVDPLTGTEWKPYPEGEERTRINAAFDKLFEVLREEKVFEKAMADAALMDAVFGVAA